MKTNNWLDIQSRINIWEHVYEKEHENQEIKVEKKIKERLLKVYELVVIFSSLSCASLVGVSESKNENKVLVIIYDCIRGYGIVTSSLGAIISLSSCMIISVLPDKYIMNFLEEFMKYSNIPVITTIISILSMMICASLKFQRIVMYIVLPYSILCYVCGLYVYNKLRSKLIEILIK